MDFLLAHSDRESRYNRGPFPDLHLNSPLNNYLAQSMLTGHSVSRTGLLRWALREAREMKSALGRPGLIELEHFVEIWSDWIMQDITVSELSCQTCNLRTLCERKGLHWCRQFGLLDGRAPPNNPECLMWYKHIDHLLGNLVLWSGCLASGRKIPPCPPDYFDIAGFRGVRLPGGLEVIVGKNCCRFQRGHLTYWGQRDHLLCLHGIVSDRFRSLRASWISFSCYPDMDLPDPVFLERVYKWGDSCLAIFGNAGYDVIKHVEPVCMGILIARATMPGLQPRRFLDQELSALKALMSQTPSLVSELHLWVQHLLCPEVPLTWSSEIFGIYRQWGHPEVIGLAGLEAIKEIGTLVTVPNPRVVSLAHGFFIETVMVNYFKRHHKYPPVVKLNLPVLSEVRRAVEGQVIPNQDSPLYSMEDWRHIEWGKCFPLALGSNLVTALSDKSHSAPEEELVKAIKKGNLPPAWSRRVLLSWLATDQPSVEELLVSVGSGNLKPGEWVLGVRPKERELKRVPRLFGLLPFRVRQWVVYTEHLLSDVLLPLFPFTTMRDTAQELTIKLSSQSRRQGPIKDVLHIVINIDFQKWNTHMRDNLTKNWFLSLDSWFGIKGLYSFTHEFFTKSTIYLADNSVRLPIADQKLGSGPGIYRGHLGGIEGLRQKGWTICTSSIIGMVAQRHHLTHAILGQGDNQVISIEFPLLSSAEDAQTRDLEVQDVLVRFCAFKEDLFASFQEVCLPIKEEETWISDKVLAYGKKLFVAGVEMPTSLKRLCKITPFSNLSFPGVNQSLAALSGAAGNCMDQRNDCSLPYLLWRIEGLELLMELYMWHPILECPLRDMLRQIRQHKYKDGDLFCAKDIDKSYINSCLSHQPWLFLEQLLVFPLLLGGIAICHPYSLMMRGFPDPLSADLNFLSSCHDKKLLPGTLVNVLASPICLQSPDPLLLLEDPVSIPVVGAPNQGNLLKSFVLEYLNVSPQIGNTKFKRLLQYRNTTLDPLVRWLWSVTPCNPRLYSDILSATIAGVMNSVIARFEKTETLTQLVYQLKGESVSQRIAALERRTWSGVCLQFGEAGHPLSLVGRCPNELARELRRLGWKREDIIGVSVPFPAHMLGHHLDLDGSCSVTTCTSSGFILSKVTSQISRTNVNQLLTVLGKDPAYLGSRTEEKAPANRSFRSIEVDDFLRRSFLLQRTIGWFIPQESSLARLIRGILTKITDLDPYLFSNVGRDVSGAVEHRYRDTLLAHGGYVNTLTNVYTHLHISTNLFSKYSKGGTNYNVHFQAIMLYVEYLHSFLLRSAKRVFNLHFYEACPECSIELEAPPPESDTDFDLTLLPSTEGWDGLWLSKADAQHLVKDMCTLAEWSDSTLTADGGLLIICNWIWTQCRADPRGENAPMIWLRRLDPDSWDYGMVWTLAIHLITTKMDFSTNPNGLFSLDLLLKWGELSLTYTTDRSFKCVSPWFSDTQARTNLSNSRHKVPFPNCAPYKVLACASYFKRRLLECWCSLTALDWKRLSIRFGLKLPLLDSSQLSHKELLWKVGAMIFLHRIIWRPDHCANGVSLINQLTHLLKAWSTVMPVAPLRHLQTTFKIRLVPELFAGTLDKLVKNLPPFTSQPTSSIPELSIQGLPNVCSVLFESALEEHEKLSASGPLGTNLLPFAHAYRPVRDLTSAGYKYLSIFAFLHANGWWFNANPVFCLADGSGGIAMLCKRLAPYSDVAYVSLLNEDGAVEHSIPEYMPAAQAQYGEATCCSEVSRLVARGEQDLSTDAGINWIINSYRAVHGARPVQLFTCDAEIPEEMTNDTLLRLIQGVWTLTKTLGDPQTIVIFKAFANSRPFLRACISNAMALWAQLIVLASPFSSTNSTEIFLVLSKVRMDKYYREIPDSIVEATTSRLDQCRQSAIRNLEQFSPIYTDRLLTTLTSISFKETVRTWMSIIGIVGEIQAEPPPDALSWHYQLSHVVRVPRLHKRGQGHNVIRDHFMGKHLAQKVWLLLSWHATRQLPTYLDRLQGMPSLDAKGYLLVFESMSSRLGVFSIEARSGPELLQLSFESQVGVPLSWIVYSIPNKRIRDRDIKDLFNFAAVSRHLNLMVFGTNRSVKAYKLKNGKESPHKDMALTLPWELKPKSAVLCRFLEARNCLYI